MSYHVRIMNIPAYEDAPFEYKEGHRDARHAAAEIANEAEAEAERLQARLDACASLLEASTREGVIAEALAEAERLQARVRELEVLLRTLLGLHDAEVFVREPWDTTFNEVRAAVSAETEDDERDRLWHREKELEAEVERVTAERDEAREALRLLWNWANDSIGSAYGTLSSKAVLDTTSAALAAVSAETEDDDD